MDKSKRKNGIGKVYKPQGKQYWIAISVIVIMVFQFNLIGQSWLEAYPLWTFVFCPMPMYGYLFFNGFVLIAQTRITFFEDGLEYRKGSQYLFVEWHDMSHLGRNDSGKNPGNGIFLKYEVQANVQGKIDKLIFGSLNKKHIPLSGIVNIPTKNGKIDYEKFAETEFGQDLKSYAPHLFEKGKI